jgi:uncharacterized membrane protein YhfC
MDILFRLLNVFLMIAFPIGLGVIIYRRWGLEWRTFLVGAATFIGSQVLHIPFNLVVLTPIMDKLGLISTLKGSSLIFFGLILGLSAGVFEEGTRYLVYRLWLRDVKRWKEAVFFGAGHGGIEAILLGGLALLAFFQAAAYRNADLTELVPPEQLQLARTQLDAYWSAPWYAAILGAVERSLAIIIQISLAVLVFQSVVHRKVIWLLFAVGWHTVVDALAVFGIQTWDVYITEGLLAILAGISLWMILSLRTKEPEEMLATNEDEDDLPKVIPPRARMKADVSKERLEDSRYRD